MGQQYKPGLRTLDSIMDSIFGLQFCQVSEVMPNYSAAKTLLKELIILYAAEITIERLVPIYHF